MAQRQLHSESHSDKNIIREGKASPVFILRRIRKRIKGIFAVLAALTMAFSVGRNNEPNDPSSETTKGLILSTTKIETTVVTESGSQKSENQNETYIILADDMTTINGRGASFSDGVVTVSKSGNYSFKGELIFTP